MNLKSGKHLWLPEKSFFPGHHKQHVGFFRNDEKYDLTAFSFKLIICIFHLLVGWKKLSLPGVLHTEKQ